MNDLIVSSDKRFGRALFGLNKTEVYEYLNKVSSSYEELQFQIQVLKEQNDKLTDSNRENSLKIYNMQGELTEAQRKTDKVNVELEASKKQVSALKQELAEAQARIQKLTDDLIKASAAAKDEDKTEEKTEEKVEAKAEETKVEEPKKEEPKAAPKDIFAELRQQAASEKKAEAPVVEEPKKEEPKVEPEVSNTASSAEIFDDDEVYAGEVEIEVDESMLIGNDDDEDEGFNFL